MDTSIPSPMLTQFVGKLDVLGRSRTLTIFELFFEYVGIRSGHVQAIRYGVDRALALNTEYVGHTLAYAVIYCHMFVIS